MWELYQNLCKSCIMKRNRIKNVVWRNEWPTFRFQLDGDVITLALGVQDEEAARTLAAAITKTIQLERARARLELAGIRTDVAGDATVLERFPALRAKLGALRIRQDLPNLDEIIAAFMADVPGREISDNAARAYTNYLRRIVRIVHQVDDVRAGAMKANVIRPELFQDYQSFAIEAARPNGPAAMITARNTSFSAINQAQAVFSVDAMQGRHMRALQLPAELVTRLRGFQPKGTTRKVRVETSDELRETLRAGAEDLWFTAPARWLALALCGNLGLRRGSAKMARWDWVRRVGGQWRMYLVATDENSPKGNEQFVTVRDDVWQDMCELRQAGSDYIVPGARLEDRDRVFDENLQWLRCLGVDADKPTHELRAIFAQEMKRQHGAQAAQDGLGHGDARTTEIYTGRGTTKSVRTL